MLSERGVLKELLLNLEDILGIEFDGMLWNYSATLSKLKHHEIETESLDLNCSTFI